MSDKQTTDITYSVLTTDQWRVHPRDFAEALRQRGLGAKFKALMDVYQHTRFARAQSRYQYQRGAITAGGITYMSIFSLAALITVGWTVFAHLFSANPEFQESVIHSVNSSLPGVLSDPATGEKGLINPEGIRFGAGNTIAGIVAFVIALVSATRIVQYVSDGMRAMFGLLSFPRGPLATVSQGISGLVILSVGVGATAGLTALSQAAVGWANSKFPLLRELHDSLTFDVVSLIVPFVVDILAFALFVRFVAWVRVPKRSMIIGAIAFGVIAALLRELGTLVVGASGKDPIIAAAATVGTLMLWVNFLARFALQICAWMANPPSVVDHVSAADIHAHHRPNYVSLSDPETLDWPYHPISGDLIPAMPVSEDDEAASPEGKPKSSGKTKSAEQQSSAADHVMTEPPIGPEEADWTVIDDDEGVADPLANDSSTGKKKDS